MVKTKKSKNLIGYKFERLTVIEYVGLNVSNHRLWKCKCDCGNEKITTTTNLVTGKTKSCGCLQKEIIGNIRRNYRKYNKYNLNEEYGIGYTFKNEKFYFDLEDYDLIKNICWYKDETTGYIVGRNENQILVSMHRLILNVPNDLQVDHINRIRHNNRRYNLREATNQQNSFNTTISTNNTSGIKGVSWNKGRNKWEAYICINYKKVNLGLFNTLLEAKNARDTAEVLYFGDRRALDIHNTTQKIMGDE